ncbi:MAG: M23 family metallopeptidase [Duncaniella sp.]|nr:M23 family metallopeptidase [Duncaniella sp.]
MYWRLKFFTSSLLLLSSPAVLAQDDEDDIMSLIAICGGGDTIPSGSVSGVLSFVESTAITDTIARHDDVIQSPRAGKANGLGILSAIADAYSANGYYDSGTWARDEYILYPAAMTPPVSGVEFRSPRPVRITSPYGYREKFHRMHYGVDISMCVGDTIRLPMPGTVSYVGYDARGYGHYIIVSHDNEMETRYAHLSKPLVMQGLILAAGDPIALSGNTGNSTGPHLHLEARYRGLPVDPLAVFTFCSPTPSGK